MMYLAIGMHVEGPTDRRFLEPVIRNVLYRCLRQNVVRLVEIAEQFIPISPDDRTLHVVRNEAVRVRDTFNIMFIHCDGSGDPIGANRDRIWPIVSGLQPFERVRCVGIVPVRETEAWILADPNAIRGAFGTNKPAEELGLPITPNTVEAIAQPKQLLERAWQIASGGRRSRRRKSYGLHLTTIGERADLSMLDQVDSFQTFVSDTDRALRELRYYQ